MRFYTVQLNGQQAPAIGLEEQRFYLTHDLGLDYADMNQLIANITPAELEQLKQKIGDTAGLAAVPCYAPDQLRLCAPIPNPAQDIVCLGVNYNEHIQEVGGEAAEYTVYFAKRANYVSGPLDKIPSYPGLVDSLDYEVELAVILGKDAKGVSEQDALNHVFGYSVFNDVTARNLQFRHQQWYLGKSLDGFSILGPCIVTPDELPDPQNLSISCKVNGEVRQSSNTKYMIQPIAKAIAELSQGMTLKAGTIIATGTPGGVALGMKPQVFLKPGDEVLCEIQQIGALKNMVE